MKKSILACMFLGCWTSLSSLAQSGTAPQPVTVELSTESQHLSNGSPDWQEASLRLNRLFGPRQQVDVTLLQANRFGLRDEQILVSHTRPLTEKLTGIIDANLSPTHNVLAQHSLGLMLQYEFAPAWLIHGGAKDTRYSDTSVQQGTLMLEHYISSFSWAVAWRPVRAMDTTSHNSELRGSYYYGDRNFVGLIWATGQEATSLSPAVVALADIRSLALTGRHWLHRDWAISYGLNTTQQGNFYNRDGIRIGVQCVF